MERGRRLGAGLLAAPLAGLVAGLLLVGTASADAKPSHGRDQHTHHQRTDHKTDHKADRKAGHKADRRTRHGADQKARPRDQRRRAVSVRLVGNGFGHGHGLSQWGAERAAERGLGHTRILRFYYPRLKPGRAGGNVRVLISGDTSDDVVVRARPGLKVKGANQKRASTLGHRGTARWWRLTAARGGARTLLTWRGARGGWHRQRVLPGQAQLSAGGRPMVLHTPSGNVSYRGVLRSAAPGAGSRERDTVNVLSLDSYLKGVVPQEVPASWPAAAVRAQAVAARTYAAFERRHPLARHYQICDTTSCQVYGGRSAEVGASNRAVDATTRQVLLWHGAPAFTQFSASNGGWMAAGSQPYLVAKKDPYDNTYRGWTDHVSASEVQRAYPALGTFRGARVVRRDGHGQWGGRVLSIRLTGSRASTTLDGETFRSVFGLNSTWFRLR